jgi:hypothetical protein
VALAAFALASYPPQRLALRDDSVLP